MRYKSSEDWTSAESKRVLLFGMSGVGKTYLSNKLRNSGGWYHYSVDYRIGTRYMGEHIVDNFKREAMRNPFLADHLLSDSIYIASNITFNNLTPLSAYIGKPGNPQLGGLPIAEYRRRQNQHHEAEVAALLDTRQFIRKAREIYNYPHFICDSGGSICEVVSPDDPQDSILRALCEKMLLIWIKGDKSLQDKLRGRFHKSPKPMYYRTEFLDENWNAYRKSRELAEDEVDPDDFSRWCYERALHRRQPLYAAIAKNWGVSIDSDTVAQVKSADDFDLAVAHAIKARPRS